MRVPKFVIKNAPFEFHFNLVAPNGEIIATSEMYTSLEACKKGINAVKKYAKTAKVKMEE
jgi:uncharacterized protein YegP (UPF0339 family)